MIDQCPHCSGVLRFSDAHKEKLASALESLPAGKSLKFACPRCKEPIELDKSGQALGKSAVPDGPKETTASLVQPPKPPDISWLDSGEIDQESGLEDVPSAMVLVDDPGLAEKVRDGLDGYQVVVPQDAQDAMDSMRFKTFEVVVLYSGYRQTPFEAQGFHHFMMKMGMKKRRKIFYVLLGPEFETLYDLQALTFSANLVVNPAQMNQFPVLFKKGLKEYEELFSPYLAALKQHGKD